MRILHVATHAQPRRGGAVQLCRMATGLVARGHAVRVVANHLGDDLPFEAAPWRERLPAAVPVDGVRLARAWGRWKLAWTIRSWAPDVIHVHRDDAVKAIVRTRRGATTPPVVAQRGTTRVPGEAVAAAMGSAAIAGVVVVADRVKDVLVREARVPAAKIRTIYGSVDLDKFQPRPRDDARRRELNLADGDFVIGSLSAWRPEKGLESILRAAARAHREEPSVALLFLGDGVEKKLAPLAQELGFADRCRFVGHQSDVAAWLAAMDVSVVAATSREGLSGVLRESLACGIPVVSTDSDGNPEIVRDGDTGLLVPAGDDAALAAAFLRAMRDRPALSAMATRGRDWVRANCSLERQAESLEAFYTELIGGVSRHG